MYRSGSGVLVSTSFKIIPRLVGRLGSGVRVSDSFQILVIKRWGNVLGGEGNCPRKCPGGNVRRENVQRQRCTVRNVQLTL